MAVPSSAPNSSIQVVPVDGREALWTSLLSARPGEFPYHELAVRDLLLKTFGHRSHYLMALRGAHPVGLLPLFEMRSLLFGRFLVSLPFLSRGGVAPADDPEALAALLQAAAELGARLAVDRVEIRQGRQISIDGWTCRDHKATMTVLVEDPPDVLLAGLSSRLRGKIRKAGNNDASFETGGKELLGDFYDVFSKNMRDLGTPVYSKALFHNFLKTFPERATVFLVRHRGRPAAGAIGLRIGDALELPWICSDYGLSQFSLNEFLYWKVIETAAQDPACRRLELGRSTIDSGPYRFKLQWKPEIEQVYWYLRPIRSSEIKTDVNDPRYSLIRSIWKKLPLGVSRLIGPRIVRCIP